MTFLICCTAVLLSPILLHFELLNHERRHYLEEIKRALTCLNEQRWLAEHAATESHRQWAATMVEKMLPWEYEARRFRCARSGRTAASGSPRNTSA